MQPSACRSSSIRGSAANPDSEIMYGHNELTLQSMKVLDLKDMCRDRNLLIGGRKADLVKRILQHDAKVGVDSAVNDDTAYGICRSQHR